MYLHLVRKHLKTRDYKKKIIYEKKIFGFLIAVHTYPVSKISGKTIIPILCGGRVQRRNKKGHPAVFYWPYPTDIILKK